MYGMGAPRGVTRFYSVRDAFNPPQIRLHTEPQGRGRLRLLTPPPHFALGWVRRTKAGAVYLCRWDAKWATCGCTPGCGWVQVLRISVTYPMIDIA